MWENKYRSLTPRQFIDRLFDDTRDGLLQITYYPYNAQPPYTQTYAMDWTKADVDGLQQRYEVLERQLKYFGEMHQVLLDDNRRKAMLTPEQAAAWEIYARPLPAFEVELSVIGELYYRGEYDSLDAEENELLERHYRWQERISLQRLPFLRCSPSDLLLRARRYIELVALHAPEAVIENEGRCLAEEMVLYYHGPQKQRTLEDEA